jgi:hypothetical protein
MIPGIGATVGGLSGDGSGGVVTDPYFANVVLLYSGGTDYSPSPKTATLIGGANISGGRLVLSGSSQYARFPDDAGWFFGTGPFTIDGVFKFTSAPPSNSIMVCQWGGSGTWLFGFESGKFTFRTAAGQYMTQYTYSPALNTDIHFQAERDGSNVGRLFIDGVMVSKITGYNYNIPDTSDVLSIGSLLAGGFGGWDIAAEVGDVRITNGVARCGSDAGFTPPSLPFPRL